MQPRSGTPAPRTHARTHAHGTQRSEETGLFSTLLARLVFEFVNCVKRGRLRVEEFVGSMDVFLTRSAEELARFVFVRLAGASGVIELNEEGEPVINVRTFAKDHPEVARHYGGEEVRVCGGWCRGSCLRVDVVGTPARVCLATRQCALGRRCCVSGCAWCVCVHMKLCNFVLAILHAR